ncbi:aliphatic sulfonates ABC transporter substrate-binding protein, partial [Streptomyces sp. NPDC059468]
MRTRTTKVIGTVGLLALAGTLVACGSESDTAAPLSNAGAASTAKHPEWSKYTFTIGDNGGDGSQALAKLTGVFDNASYKVKFARFTYGPPLVQ